MRRILWVGCLLSGLLAAQGPPFSEWPADLKEHLGVTGEILDHALRYRSKPFPVTVTTAWGFKALDAGEDGKSTTAIVTYLPPAQPPFYAQAIICGDGKHARIFDASVLGSDETAADFFRDNTVFYMPDPGADMVECFSESLIMGQISERPTNVPKVAYCNSPDRAIRHLCYWARFFRVWGGDKKRAADFLTTALDQERILLQQMELKQDYKTLSTNLDLFDKRLPRADFDLGLPFNERQRADVRSWLATTIRIRGKLKPFLPGAEVRIAQDEAILASFH